MSRLKWADSLKGVLIILVVLGHSIQETIKSGCADNHLWNYIYSFHMPAFMAVSGFLSYRGEGKVEISVLSVIFRRFQQLIVPFLLWSVIKVVTLQHYSINAFIDIFLYPDRYFWFLWVLFFIVVFFQLGDVLAIKLKIKQDIFIIGFCLLFVGLMVVTDLRVFGFQFFAYYFLFYALGYYLHKYNNLVVSKTWALCCLFVIWVIMGWYWDMHELPSFLHGTVLPKAITQYGYRFLTAIVAIFILFGMAPKLLDNEKNWNKPFLQLGQVSLGIYVVHLLLMSVIVKNVGQISDNSTIVLILSFVIGLVVSWLIVVLLSKWRITARFLLGKI